MELQLPSFQIIFTFLLFLFALVNILKRSKLKLIFFFIETTPGPWKLPVIGNLHQLVGPLLHQVLRDLAKKHGPLMHLKLGQLSVTVVSSPDFAKEVMKTHDVIFASRPQTLVSKIMFYDSSTMTFSPYCDYLKQLRKICVQELLNITQVQSYRPIREEELSNLVKFIGSHIGSVINLSEEIYSTGCAIISAAFGDKSKEQERFVSLLKEVVKLAGGFNIADLFPSVHLLQLLSGLRPKLERLHREADRIIDNIIKEHKDQETRKAGRVVKDLVDVLLKFHDRSDLQFSLTTDNIKAVIWDIFAAGSDTSATAVDWAMSEMMKHPRVMKKAQDEVRRVFNEKGSVDETCISEMKYLKSVIKEILRLHPPGPLLLPRECRESCVIGNGYEIPAKTKVIVNAWAIGRDPRYWNEPESFYPERFLDSSVDFKGTNYEYIPFGAGRRMCPGMSLGMINVELPLALLLYHFDWQLPKGMKHEEMDMTEKFGITVRRKLDLLLIPTAYYPSSTPS
ncbi:hypothetical protein FNV43_RR02693 [Rhamnella rubrinervis]|uniref:Cytochrome P450 n=1 Tax=Rhamnella rubrinervis TaxID=2594499 RepID=A0A8K0MTW4_9ROSA|nr:hypothetical protein FNV43_RR02693 [Rhamnella rubrinervis]